MAQARPPRRAPAVWARGVVAHGQLGQPAPHPRPRLGVADSRCPPTPAPTSGRLALHDATLELLLLRAERAPTLAQLRHRRRCLQLLGALRKYAHRPRSVSSCSSSESSTVRKLAPSGRVHVGHGLSGPSDSMRRAAPGRRRTARAAPRAASAPPAGRAPRRCARGSCSACTDSSSARRTSSSACVSRSNSGAVARRARPLVEPPDHLDQRPLRIAERRPAPSALASASRRASAARSAASGASSAARPLHVGARAGDVGQLPPDAVELPQQRLLLPLGTRSSPRISCSRSRLGSPPAPRAHLGDGASVAGALAPGVALLGARGGLAPLGVGQLLAHLVGVGHAGAQPLRPRRSPAGGGRARAPARSAAARTQHAGEELRPLRRPHGRHHVAAPSAP
jgi:hypothetical protein